MAKKAAKKKSRIAQKTTTKSSSGTASMRKYCLGGFPTFAVILLIFGGVWLLNDLEIFAVTIPWVPLVLIVIAIGMIINSIHKK